MMFLLHQPNRQSKVKRYQKQNEKLLRSLSKENSLDAILEENNRARKAIGE